MSFYTKHARKIRAKYKYLKTEIQKYFYYGCLVDSWLLDLILLPYITLHWKQEPTWYRVIGPPGSGKTKHLTLLDGHPLTYMLDDFTPRSFVSGFRGTGGEDPSKIEDMNDKVVVIGDESTIVEQRQEERNQAMSILRRIYDGKISKIFGNIREKQEYDAYFNMITAATPQIDRFFLYNQALGERFMNFRLVIPDREKIARAAFRSQFITNGQSYNVLQREVHKFIDYLPEIDLSDINISPAMEDKIIAAANFIALIRTHITRDVQGRHVTTMPHPETAGRLVKQITQTVCASALLRGAREVTDLHVARGVYVGLCAITSVHSYILYNIYKMIDSKARGDSCPWFPYNEIVLRTKLGTATVKNILDDLGLHRVLDIRKARRQGRMGFEYRLNDKSLKTIVDINMFKYYHTPYTEDIKQKRLDRQRYTGTKHKSTPRKKKKRTGKVSKSV